MIKRRALYLSSLIVIFLLSIGISFAWFRTQLSLEGTPTNMITETGTLHLTYVDGPQIEGINIRPGWYKDKVVRVENDGTFETSYRIYWKDLINTVSNNEMVISATCVQTLEGVETGTCQGIEETPITGTLISDGIIINPDYVQTYTLRVMFKETGSEQNYNQGKNFSGVVQIEGSNSAYVAKIENDFYESLDDAIDNVPNTNVQTTIKLLSNINEDVEVSENKNVVLDLNYQTLRGKITNDGIITINGQGTIDTSDVLFAMKTPNVQRMNYSIKKMSEQSLSSAINNNGTMTINSGTFVETTFRNEYAFIDNIGSLTINGGNIDSVNSVILNDGILNMTDGSANNSNMDNSNVYTVSNRGTLNISGGTINKTSNLSSSIINDNNLTISGSANINSSGISINNNSLVTINGGTINGKTNAIVNYPDGTVNMNNGFVGLDNTNNSGTTIINNGDITVAGGTISTVNKTIENNNTLTLTGGTITSPRSTTVINSLGSELYVQGGNLTNTNLDGESAVTNEGTLVASTGTISGVGPLKPTINNSGRVEISSTARINSYSHGIENTSTSTLTITGGTFTTHSNTITGVTDAIIYIPSGMTASITGGTFNNTTTYGGNANISQAAIFENEGALSVSGTTINSTNNLTHAIINRGTLTLGNNNITSSNSIIDNKSGTTTISGGSITSNAGYDLISNKSGATLNITGGTIRNTNTVVGSLLDNSGTTTISGGTLINDAPHTTAVNNHNNMTISGSANITALSFALQNDTNGILRINGGTIETTANTNAAVWNALGTLTMTSGTVRNTTATGGACIINMSTANISGGNISNTGDGYVCVTNSSSLTLSGTVHVTSSSNALGNNEDGQMYINGGRFTSTVSTTIQNSGVVTMTGGILENTFSEGQNAIYNAGTFTMSGGTATNLGTDVILLLNIEGSIFNISGTASLSSMSHVLSNLGTINISGGDVTGNYLATVFNQTGGVMNISGGNITNNYTSSLVLANYGTMDISGGNITYGSTSNFMTDNYGIMYVRGSAKLTASSNAIALRAGGSLTVSGGTISGSGSGAPTVYIIAGTFSMTSGTIRNTASGYAVYKAGGTATVSGGTATPRNF